MSTKKDPGAGSTVADVIADYAVSTKIDDLPAEVIERAKMLVFDQLACAFVGSELSAGQVITKYVRAMGGTPEAGVLGSSGLAVPAPLAALANGTSGHADEFDSVHSTSDFLGTGHPSASVIPAVIAVAERQSASGNELINALVLGYDVGARTVSATGGLGKMENTYGIYAGSLHAVGGAVGSARLLGLDPRRTRYAAGLALGQGINGFSFFAEKRHMSKALNEGVAAAAGVSGAILASFGLEATEDIFSGRGGVLASWGMPGREEVLTSGLGSEYEVMGVNFKFYSAGYPIHSATEAVLSLKAEHGFDTSQIVGIEARLPAYPASVVDDRGMPTISLQHMISVALVADALGFDEAHSSSLQSDPEVLRLRALTRLTGDPDFEVSQPRGADMVIVLADGTRLQRLIEHPKGHRFRFPHPGWEDIEEKWSALLERRIGSTNATRFARMCRGLEAVDDVAEVSRILAPAPT